MENFNFFGQDDRHIPALDPVAHGIPVLDPAVHGIPALNPVVHGIPALNPVVHGIPSLDPAQRVMAKLQETSAELSDKIRAVAEQDSTIINLRHSVFALSFNLSERERTLAECNRVLAERDQALLESRQTAAGQVQFISSLLNTNTALSTRASEHDRVVAELQHTVSEQGGTIDDLRRTIAELQRANADHVRANSEQGGIIVELQRTNSKQGSAIADLQCANAEKEHIIVDLRRSNTEHERTVTELQRANSNLMRTNGEQEHTIAELQRTVAALQHRDTDHVRANSEQGDTIANLQRTVAALQHRDSAHVRTINELQRNVTDLQQANAGHVQTIDELERANADQQSQLNEAHCTSAICLGGINYLMNRFAGSEYGTDIHRQSLDAAIPPPDILADDYDSDVTDMIVDIPTTADTVATTSATPSVVASPVIDPLPSFDLADSTHQRPLGAIYDQSGAKVTSESLLAVVKPFVFIDLDLLRDIYYDMNGCRLLSGGVSLQDFIRGFDRMEGLKFWAPRLTRADSTRPVDLNFLQRCDSEPGDLTRSILRRLGLALDTSAVVLGPVLCYTLVILCGTRVDRMTGSILEQMFAVATGEELHSLWVTTASGTHQMSGAEHCLMVKDWVKGLVEHIAMDNGLNQSLDMTKQCYRIYSRRCAAESYDSMANVAAKMLDSNEHFSQLFLGLQKADLKALCKLLVHVIDSDTSPQIKDSLRRVAGELQQRTV